MNTDLRSEIPEKTKPKNEHQFEELIENDPFNNESENSTLCRGLASFGAFAPNSSYNQEVDIKNILQVFIKEEAKLAQDVYPIPDIQFSDNAQSDSTSVTNLKGRKAKVMTDLTSEEEELMVDWLKSNPILYNKKLQAYKDLTLKENLWQDKAYKMKKSVLVLKTWYSSLRSRYGRLKKLNSGQEATEIELSERDFWIKSKFEFLRPHIHEIHKKSSACINLKSAKVSNTTDVSEDDEVSSTDRLTPAVISSSVYNSIMSSSKSLEKVKNDDNSVAFEDRQNLSLFLREILQELKPNNVNQEREAFVDWVRSVILDLEYSLWRSCQQEISKTLYRFIKENDQLKSEVITNPSYREAATPSVSLPEIERKTKRLKA